MNKVTITLILCLISNIIFSQTKNDNLNKQLNEMKGYFLKGNYEAFSNYTYPKVIKMMGGKTKLVQATKNSMDQMKNEGFSFLNLNFINPSSILKKEDELQCSLTQQLLMKTPQGKILAEYTLIAISGDEGQNWRFIDTSGKSKEIMLKYFPNLNSEIIIKPKTQKSVN